MTAGDGGEERLESAAGVDATSVPKRRLRLGCVAALCLVAVGIAYLAKAVGRAQEAAARASCNLGGIQLAFHNYHAQYGHLPPAYSVDRDGRPLLSWRVLILPYIEERELYAEFHLDEPWDSPHNIQLLERMPRSYEAPWKKRVDVPPYHTLCRVLVGPGTAFERPGLNLEKDFPDGPNDTLLFVEAGEPVPWTKPEAIEYDPSKPVELTGLFSEGFRSCVVGGSYRFIRYDTDPQVLHALITRNGGETMAY